MTERSSRFVQETREKESWLDHLLEGDPEGRKEVGQLLATASLVRAAGHVEVPEGAEEASRERALNELLALKERRQAVPAPAPGPSWFMRFGSAMRFVFTLGKKR